LDESCVGKFPLLIEKAGRKGQIIDLYRSTEKHFGGLDEFVLTLDALFALGIIEVEWGTGAYRIC
jgi:hypothetical protein